MRKSLLFFATLLVVMMFGLRSYAQVSVTSSGGTTTATYTTLGAAFTAINAGTHTGTITVQISANTTESAACVLNSGDAAPASYTSVSIRPSADGVTISGTTVAGHGVIELNGADNVVIDGDNPNTTGTNQNLTITNAAGATTQFTSVIRLVTGTGVTSADNDTIRNCVLNGSATTRNASANSSGAVQNTMGIYGGGGAAGATTAPPALTAVNTTGTTMNNLMISNNTINNCARGISINGSSLTAINSMTVSGNTIGGAGTLTGTTPFTSISSTVYTVAITIQGATICNITGNTIRNILSYNSNAPIRGIEVQGNSASSLTIQNNTITGVSENSTSSEAPEGIYVGGMPTTGTLLIDKNTISTIETPSTAVVSGINLNNTNSPTATISNNKLTKMYNTNAGAYEAMGINLNGGNNVLVYNNFVSDVNVYADNTVTSTFYQPAGITVNASTTGHHIYHNTINLFGGPLGGSTNNGTSCIFITSSSSSNLDIRNNVLSNQFTGWPSGSVHACIFIPTGMSGITINNNAYYAASGNYVCQNGSGTTYPVANFSATTTTPAGNFRSFSTTLGFATNDNASVAVTGTVPFVSTTDLHIPNGTASPLESGGATVGITTDIDGDARPGPAGSTHGGATAPDMGADEFDGIPLDVVPPTITYTPLTSLCSVGNSTVTATITDNTGVPVTGSNVPRIYYRKNTGTWFSQPGTLASGTSTNGTWTFVIQISDMGGLTTGSMVSYYIIAQDGTPNVSANPGTGLVATNVNTVTTPPTTPNTYFLQPSSGTFNVGTTGAYTTITSAVNSYNSNTCLTGPIVYNLTDATYPSETFPITITNNALASSVITLTIQAAAGVAAVVNATSSSTAVLKMQNARYITVNGVNTGGASLTLSNPNTGTAAGIWLASTGATGSGNSNIVLKNMNIVVGSNTTTSDWGIIACVDGSSPGGTNGQDNDNITITGNTITQCGYGIWSSGTTAVSAGANDNWVVSNNNIGPASGATTTYVGVNGMFFNNMVNLKVSDNTLQNIGLATSTAYNVAGIYLQSNINGAQVTHNTITNLTSKATGTGTGTNVGVLFGNAVINSSITRNTMTTLYNASTASSPGGVRAIIMNTATAASNDTIANNMISDIYGYSNTSNTRWPIGIDIDGASGGINIWYNSVNMFGSHAGNNTATGGACLFINTSANNIDVRNNIFSNTYDNSTSSSDKSYAIYSANASTVFNNIDNNDYYTATPDVLGYLSSDRATMAAIQTGFGSNLHSFSANPAFTSTTNLHIPAGTTSQLESGAIPVGGIAVDIDLDARPGPAGSTHGGGTIPDIGADEFDGYILDLIPPSITYTALTNACSTGDRTITATISDATGVNTTTTLQPRIYFKKNSGSWFSAAATSSTGTATNGTWNFTISAATMGGLAITDVVSYFIIAQDVATTPNIGSSPAAGLVATDVNTVTTYPTTPNTFTVIPTLNGTYAIGATGAYTTITAAANAYNNSCLTGPVVFTLTDGTYPSETYPITLNGNSFASATNTLTIKPAAATAVAVTSGSSSASVFKFLNAKYITLDGVNSGGATLTVTNGNTGTNTCNLWLSSPTAGPGNSFITLKNMNIVGGSATTGSASEWAIVGGIDGSSPNATNGPDNDNITITGNTITRSGYAIWAAGTAATSAGGNDNWVVSNNICGPTTADANNTLAVNGMFFRNMVNFTLTSNTIQNIISTFGTAGFYLEQNITGANVTNNTFTNITSNSSSTSYVIYVGTNVINSNISRNKITTVSSTYSFGFGGTLRAIDLNTGNAASNDTIANNMITDLSEYSAQSGYWLAGIAVESGAGGLGIYYNSVSLFGNHSGYNSNSGSVAFYNLSSASGLDVRDNIFSNTYHNTGSTSDKGYAIYSSSGSTAFTNLDYNDYYVETSNVLGYNGSSDQATLANLQSSLGGNTHSINVLPVFTSGTDLHLQTVGANVPFIAGTPITSITTDIFGTTRSGTTPVIGAHEVNIPACTTAVAGTVTSSMPVLCGTSSPALSLAGASPGAYGLNYVWQSSPDCTTWSTVAGATNPSYTPTVSATTYYRATLTCTITSATATTPCKQLIVNPVASPISGSVSVCAGANTTLSDASTFGMWSTDAPSVASIGSTTGVVSGGTTGVANITYTLSTGCTTSTPITVVQAPVVTTTASPGAICDGAASVLNATATNPGANIYSVYSIPYAMPTFTTAGTLNSGTTYTAGNYDDGYYTVPLPFAFTFYGVNYASGANVNIGTNGFLFFTSPVTSTYINTMPNTSFGATIAFYGRDMTMVSTGSVTYGVAGTAPNRQFIISYNAEPDYSTGGLETGEMILYEGSNNIDFQISTAQATTHTFGVQSASGASATTIAGQNNTSTAITNSGWRFIPPAAVTYAWSPSTSLSTTTAASTTAGPLGATSTYTVAVTAANGCSNTGAVTVTVNPLPSVYAVTGGGSYCSGGTGVAVGLANSTVGVNYQLYRGTTSVGSAVAGTGSAISFGMQTISGSYSAIATNATAGCTNNMSGSVNVSINPLPTVYPVTGGGGYCSGGTGAAVGLLYANSGVNYQLYRGSSTVGSVVPGANAALNFGLQTVAGTYSVSATDATTGCTNNMSGTTTVSVNALPAASNLTGGGGYCAGGAGVAIGLDGSASGINYQLYNGSTATGAAIGGTGGSISFGLQTAAGTYSVLATNATTGCIAGMTGTKTVSINTLPAVFTVTGSSTSYCAGGAGITITLPSSETGVSYQLYNGAASAGISVAGTGSAISFGTFTATGTYTAVATNTTTNCTSNMTGAAVISINPLPTAYTVTGGGGYCAGGTGMAVGLSNSTYGVNYQLYNGTTAGSIVAGTGTSISFGLQTAPGTYTISATNATTGCTSSMTGSTDVIVNPLPVAYTVSGSGSYCAGGAGIDIQQDVTDPGINYQLYNGATMVGAVMPGNGGGIDYGFQTAAGVYTVLATDAVTNCTTTMMGNGTIVVNPLPVVHTVTGGGSYCAGAAGVDIALDGSDLNVHYQLNNGTTAVGASMPGTGLAIDFGNQTTEGAYTIVASSDASGCTSNMSGGANISINPLPAAYYVTGGGNYCAGGAGVHVGLTASNLGISYQLYNGSTIAGTQPGTGLGTDFGLQTATGTYSVLATDTATGCTSNMTGTTSIGINALPAAHNVIGGGSYCAGGAGQHIYLDSSDAGINYQLYYGAATSGSAIAGIGDSLDFGSLTSGGTYTVLATDAATGCTNGMTGSALINVNSLPAVFTIAGGGSYCAGGTGVDVSLPNSESGINYQLYDSSTAIGTLMAGTGSGIDFGSQTAAGTYSIVATNGTTGCSVNMHGIATVTINAQPIVYGVTGTGNYCIGGTGVHVGLTGSDTGVTYQLYNGATTIDGLVPGTGTALDFGLQTATGTYTVVANPATACATTMGGSAVINTNPLPTADTVTGGGSYCAGGTGEHVGLSTSTTGVNYQLYDGATAITTVAGTGGAIDFGLQTAAGTYTVLATDTNTCQNAMAGHAIVAINPLLVPSVTVAPAAGTTVCAGTLTTFTATPTNGGSAPVYQWSVNGTATTVAPTASASYSYVPVDGDIVSAVVTSNATCASPDTASNSVAITVVNNVLPVASISATSSNVCQGTAVTYSASVLYGGSAGTYAWVRNGTVVDSTLSFTDVPTDGEIVYLVLNSSLSCVTMGTVFSNNILMTVDTPFIPVVTIASHPGATILPGVSDTLIASVLHAGLTPSYQWKLNGTNIPGATNSSYVSNTFANNDSVTCYVTSSGACGLSSFNSVIIKINNVGVVQVSENNGDIRLLPNPNKGSFDVKGTLNTITDQEVSLEITDMLGQVVYKNKTLVKGGNLSEHIELSSNLANGMYMLNVHSDTDHKVFHFVLEQ